jgi:hypothetical protein
MTDETEPRPVTPGPFEEEAVEAGADGADQDAEPEGDHWLGVLVSRYRAGDRHTHPPVPQPPPTPPTDPASPAPPSPPAE